MDSGTGRVRSSLCIVAVACAAAGCDRSTVGGVATALAEREQVDFNYLVLQPDANGRYTIRMNYSPACADHVFDLNQLSDMLRSKQFELTHIIGGRPVTVNAVFSFDKLGECFTPGEARYENEALSEPVTDANGMVTGRKRPQTAILTKLVDPELSGNGVLNVLAYEFRLVGQTASSSRAPGLVAVTTAEVPASLVGGSSGIYTAANVNPSYAEAQVVDVLGSPDRFTATFSFLGKADPADDQLLLVWDGDMVLRTDL